MRSHAMSLTKVPLLQKQLGDADTQYQTSLPLRIAVQSAGVML